MKITERQIEAEVKLLAKKSTAPDKETPDWMEADIRRGLIRGLEIAGFEKIKDEWRNDIGADY